MAIDPDRIASVEVALSNLSDAESLEAEELDALASQWIDVTNSGSPYQIFMNTDGRVRWRPRCKPEDSAPEMWRKGNPPGAEG